MPYVSLSLQSFIVVEVIIAVVDAVVATFLVAKWLKIFKTYNT